MFWIEKKYPIQKVTYFFILNCRLGLSLSNKLKVPLVKHRSHHHRKELLELMLLFILLLLKNYQLSLLILLLYSSILDP